MHLPGRRRCWILPCRRQGRRRTSTKERDVRGKSARFLLLALVALALAVTAVACGGDDEEEAAPPAPPAETGGAEPAAPPPAETEEAPAEGGGTLVFGAAADPVVLDPALISDGESYRVTLQIYETLIRNAPGSTELEPSLAESWEANADGTSWTFTLRQGVNFHDGTPFNAAAVCANFDRWYNFEGSFQNPSATYYWQYAFGGGFKNPVEGAPGPDASLYKSCEVIDDYTATINLTKPSATFLAALTLGPLAMQSPAAMEQYGANEGEVDEDGIFHPTGTYGTEHPTGTGPFKFESWTRGDKLVLVRNEDYWGEKAKLDQLIFRPIPDNAARLQALQTGEIQGYDLVEPQDIPTIQSDANLQILDRPAFNVGYVGFNISQPPLDDVNVRKAIAHALDREAVIENFYAGRGQVATQFMPPEVFGWADDVPVYEHDPEKAKQILVDAGYELPVKVEFWYPTDVSRPYMPDPKRNFEAFKASLEEAGFEVVPKSAPWNPDYLGLNDEGKQQIFLLGWTGDFGDPDNFIGTFFQVPGKPFGTDKSDELKPVHELLDRAEIETDPAAREELYKEANRLIMELLPGVPYAHNMPAVAFRADVRGYVPSPVDNQYFETVFFEQ
jgi:peptide/nickel transport system substrate-binding protein